MTTPSADVATTVTPGRTPPDPSVTAPRTRPWAGSAEIDAGAQQRASSATAASVNSDTCIEMVLGLSMTIGSKPRALQLKQCTNARMHECTNARMQALLRNDR